MNDRTDQDSRVLAWLAVARHPFFQDCYQTDGALLDAVLAKLDAARAHTCEPVWRQVSFEEIQPGWEVRMRRRDGSEVAWGNAHHQDHVGDWYTEAGVLLTYGARGWTYETTAPEPEPDPRVERLAKAMYLAYTDKPWEELGGAGRASYLREGAKVLGVFDALPEGEKS